MKHEIRILTLVFALLWGLAWSAAGWGSAAAPPETADEPPAGAAPRSETGAGDAAVSLRVLHGGQIEEMPMDDYLRGVLRAEMIDFINSIQNNVQTLTMDDQGTTRARITDQVSHTYDYTDALNDMQRAAQIVQDVPYIYFNMGNLHTLSSQMVEAIEDYNKAIQLYPYMSDAYFNRGLVLIYLKDLEKGCIDLSRAGELGVADAYSVIGKYCEEE